MKKKWKKETNISSSKVVVVTVVKQEATMDVELHE